MRFWKVSEISLFSLLSYILFNLFHYTPLFFALFPVMVLFFGLRYKELKEGKTPYIFFLYFLVSGIFYTIYVRYFLKVSFLHAPWHLLFFLFSLYFFIEIFVRFALYGRYKGLIMLITFFILFFYPDPLLSTVSISFLTLSLFEDGLRSIREEYGYMVKNIEELQRMWLKYGITFLLPLIFSLLLLSFSPITSHNFFSYLTTLVHPQSSIHTPSSTPTAKGKRVLEGERIVAIYKYQRERELPLWMKKLALWKPDKSLLVDILLLEFGLFAFLFLYKIFSGMRFWYLFLLGSFAFIILFIGLFSYVIYLIGTYILKEKAPSSWGGLLPFGSQSFNIGMPEVGNVTTKVVTLLGKKSLLPFLILNIFLIVVFIISILIILMVIIKTIRKIKVVYPEVKVKEEEEVVEDSMSKPHLTKEYFQGLIEKDPRYALEYLYSFVRSKFYPSYSALTPYELLEEIEKDLPPLKRVFWKEITALFVKTRYASFSPEKKDLLSLWDHYSAIFFNM